MEHDWKTPVRIRERAGLTHEVRTAEAALRVMSQWKATLRWQKSADQLVQVTLGNMAANDARKAFVDAAREAGVLIGE